MASIVHETQGYSVLFMRGGAMLVRQKASGKEIFFQAGGAANTLLENLKAVIEEVPIDRQDTILQIALDEHF